MNSISPPPSQATLFEEKSGTSALSAESAGQSAMPAQRSPIKAPVDVNLDIGFLRVIVPAAVVQKIRIRNLRTA
jgi:hypothetical protein